MKIVKPPIKALKLKGKIRKITVKHDEDVKQKQESLYVRVKNGELCAVCHREYEYCDCDSAYEEMRDNELSEGK